MGKIISDIFQATLVGIENELARRYKDIDESLSMLPDLSSDFVTTHYEVLSVIEELLRHIRTCKFKGKCVEL